MAKAAGETRDKILQAAFHLFYRKGFARVGIDEIASAAGVTKRTLYYHFTSKDEVLADMLAVQHALAMERVDRWASARAVTATEAVRMTFAEFTDWITRPGFAGAGMSRLATELADLPGHPARAIARRHKEAVETWFAGLLKRCGVIEPERRARELVILIEGTVVLSIIHGTTAYAKAAEQAAMALIADEGA
jgi:AcrR family transcriptional regulator